MDEVGYEGGWKEGCKCEEKDNLSFPALNSDPAKPSAKKSLYDRGSTGVTRACGTDWPTVQYSTVVQIEEASCTETNLCVLAPTPGNDNKLQTAMIRRRLACTTPAEHARPSLSPPLQIVKAAISTPDILTQLQLDSFFNIMILRSESWSRPRRRRQHVRCFKAEVLIGAVTGLTARPHGSSSCTDTRPSTSEAKEKFKKFDPRQ